MKKTLATLLLGSGLGYGGLKIYQKLTPNKQLPNIESHVINHYVNEHNLKTSHKLILMKAYMMLNRAFLDYGLVDKLNGFSFYQIYFNRSQADTEKITEIYCIFSPKDEVCGHPSIQHGGVTATIIDQNTGLLAMLNSFDIVATSQLKVKYLMPVRKGDVYLMKGWVEKREGRKIYLKATVQDLQTKKKVAEGQSLMMTVKWQHQMKDVFKFLFHKDNSTIDTTAPISTVPLTTTSTETKVL